MVWGPFSAESVMLDGQLRRLHKDGRVSEALDEIQRFLGLAALYGPMAISYEEFEACVSLETVAEQYDAFADLYASKALDKEKAAG